MATKKKAAKKAANRRGRKPDASSKSGRIRELLKTGMKPADIAKQVGCTPALVYNVRARQDGGGARRRATPRRGAGSAASTDLGGILAAVQESERERLALRRALEQIRDVVDGALG